MHINVLGSLFIVFLGLLGYPAVRNVLSTATKAVRASRNSWAIYPVRTCVGASLVFIISVGVVPYLLVFVGEFYTQLTCNGAGCAQGGVGLLMFTPLPWLCRLLLAGVQRFVFNNRYLPSLTSASPRHA